MGIFFRKNRHSEILVREKIFRSPKLDARSPPLFTVVKILMKQFEFFVF